MFPGFSVIILQEHAEQIDLDFLRSTLIKEQKFGSYTNIKRIQNHIVLK